MGSRQSDFPALKPSGLKTRARDQQDRGSAANPAKGPPLEANPGFGFSRLSLERVPGQSPDLEGPRSRPFGITRTRLFVPSPAWGGRRRREVLLGAAAVAVLFHVVMVAAIVEAPRYLPAFLRAPPPKPPPPEAELVMVKQDTPTVGGAPPPKTPAKTPAPKAPPTQAKQGGAPDLFKTPQGQDAPPPRQTDTTAPGDQAKGQDASTAKPPAPPSSVQVNLDIDGQPGWGLADPRTIPASPDDKYVNKPAGYPKSAALRGQQGTVYLAVLVAPDGRARSVQLVRSSGYAALDRAARDAVAAWHFRPAIQNGVPVQSQMREAYHFILGP